MAPSPDAPPRRPRVLVLGDSVPFCRQSAGQVLDDAWPQVLDASGAAEVRWVRASAAATAPDVLAEAQRLAFYVGTTRTWDAAVVQVGIVDCSPRPLGRRVQGLVDRVPGLRGVVVSNMRTLLRVRSRPWVSEARFERAAGALCDQVLRYAGRVVFVAILPPGAGLVAKLGDYTTVVERYNAALERVAAARPRRVALVRPAGAELLPDGHHLTVAGHRAVADAVSGAVRAG